MEIINKHHKVFITKSPMEEFCKSNRITHSSYTVDGLVERLNELCNSNIISPSFLKDNLYRWLLQGRKKILFGFFDESQMEKYRRYSVLKRKVETAFCLSSEITTIEGIHVDVDSKQHLVDIRYYKNGSLINNDKNDLEK